MEVAQRLDPMCLSAQFTRSVLAGRAGDDEKARRIVLKALSRLAIDPGMAMVAGLTTQVPDHAALTGVRTARRGSWA